MLILGRDEAGQLIGVLALATSTINGQVVAAGAWQAEYQTWIALPIFGDAFASSALECLRRALPNQTLTLRYLPSCTPLNWLTSSPASRCFRVDTHRRPLVKLDDRTPIEEVLRKKHNRSRLNRLERRGAVAFKRVSDGDELEALLAAIAPAYDLRQAVSHGSAPFQEDPNKWTFHRALMQYPELLHVTALMTGQKVASVQVNVRTRDEVHIGIPAHDPWLARESPGAFHMYYLFLCLLDEGLKRVDLTPGDDAYKERFATDFDEVRSLTLFPSPHRRRLAALFATARQPAKRLFTVVGLTPARLSALSHRVRRLHPTRSVLSACKDVAAWFYNRREMRVYSCDASKARNQPQQPAIISRDEISHLLLYDGRGGWVSRDVFLADSIRRIEGGNHVYTYVEDGRLLHYGWMTERQSKSHMDEVHQDFVFPPDSAVLFDFYTAPDARGRGLYMQSLRLALRDAANVPGTKRVYVCVLANNRASRHVIEKTGFEYDGSLIEDRLFGKRQHHQVMVTRRPAAE
jgi:GNAT superfamily N-acetyltransferase